MVTGGLSRRGGSGPRGGDYHPTAAPVRGRNDARRVPPCASGEPALTFRPALQVATHVPGLKEGEFRLLQSRPATLDAIDDFIAVEALSTSIDGLYAPVLAYLEQAGTDEQVQAVRSIMFEGEDHFETFTAVREWLGRHQERDYLRADPLAAPPEEEPTYAILRVRYANLLEGL